MLFTGLSECKLDFVVVGRLINRFVLLTQNDIAIIEITKIVVCLNIFQTNVTLIRVCSGERNNALNRIISPIFKLG